MPHLSSTNLITDLAFKSRVGVKVEASVEALAVINSYDPNIEPHELTIKPEEREELKIIAKLFLKSFDVNVALEAIHTLKNELGT